LIGIIEQLNVLSFPAAVGEVSIVATWRRYEDEAEGSMIQRVVLFSPEKEQLLTVETPFIFEKLAHRIINRVAGLPLKGPGLHELCVYVTRQGSQYPDKPASSFPIQVVQAASMQVG